MKKRPHVNRRWSPARYRALMLLIISKAFCGNHKLQYLIYQADFQHYAKHGTSLTGEKYIKTKTGISGIHFRDTLHALISAGKIKRERVSVWRVNEESKAVEGKKKGRQPPRGNSTEGK